jgi:hypothetical protein
MGHLLSQAKVVFLFFHARQLAACPLRFAPGCKQEPPPLFEQILINQVGLSNLAV